MKTKKVLAVILAVAMLTSILATGVHALSSYDYPDKEMWYDSSYFGGFMTYASLVQDSGGADFDVDTLIDSPLGKGIMETMKGSFLYSGPDDKRTFELWQQQGVNKQLLEMPDGMSYSAFAPEAALAPYNSAKLPVVIVYHGGGRNILDAEFYGFTRLCSTEDLIVVCPAWQRENTIDEKDNAGQIAEELLNDLEKRGYPIDRARVYAVGHSAGGAASIAAAIQRPDLITAIGPASSSNAGFTFSKEDYGDMAVPMYMLLGEYDYGQLPMSMEPGKDAVVQWDCQDLLDNLNNWLEMDGCSFRLDLETCRRMIRENSNEVCSFLGIYGDKNYTKTVDGGTDYIADFQNADGVTMVRFEGASNLPHFIHGSYAQLAWDFMKEFSRADDGRIVTEHTVKFVDGRNVTEKTVPVGACAEAPVAPQKDGYVFSGWWVDQDYSAKFNLQNVVTSDMTLYAKWVKEYDYPNKSAWYQEAFPGFQVYQFMSGGPSFDVEAFINSEMGEKVMEKNLKAHQTYQDDMDPDLVAYWDSLGMKKELHDEGVRAWCSYTPNQAFEGDNTKTYPVVFVMHGDQNTMLMAESYGFAELGAKEGFITVCPEANNTSDYESEIYRILQELIRQGYPIDESRLYLTGFSKGGAATMTYSTLYPETFAATTVGGMPVGWNGDGIFHTTTSRDYEKVSECTVPTIFISGVEDAGRYPISNQDIAALNDRWFTMNNIEKVAVQAPSSGTPAERQIGVAGDKSYTRKIDGTNYHFVDFYSQDNTNNLRLVAIDGLPHWPSASFAQVSWEFMSQFSRADSASSPSKTVFTDVSGENWFAGAVDYAVQRGLMSGIGNGRFAPDANLSCAAMVQAIFNMAGQPASNGAGSAASPDADALNWAASVGIVRDDENETFDPNRGATREQVAVCLFRYAAYLGLDTSPSKSLNAFTDGEKTSAWAQDAMEWAVGAKLLVGDGRGRLDPSRVMTRAEMAQMMKNFFNYGKQPGLSEESAWKSAPLAFKGAMFDVKDGTISWNEGSKEWKAEYQTSFGVTTLAGTYTEDGTMTLVEDSTGGFAKDDIPAIQAVFAGLLSGNATATPDDSRPQPTQLTEEELNAKMAVLPGNAEKYSFSTIKATANNPLKGKTIGMLGSSVVYGFASLQEAVGEYFAARFDCELVKEAVSGTTLTDTGDDSYIQRMIRNLDKDAKFDLFICQLSTNDATRGLPMGTISAGRELKDFDTATVIGGMEYVICYAQKTWNCPVVFFTGTRFDNAQYGEMVAQLKLLEDKWGIGVLDLWSDDDFNNIPETQRSLYMNDSLHPTKAGYRDWWGPELERQLLEHLSKK